jgi:hypothetical protein
MTSGGPKIREGAAAILIGSDGRLLLQLRDNLPHVSDPGKIGLFGGRREGDESFLECVVRERPTLQEQTSLICLPRNRSVRRYHSEITSPLRSAATISPA